MGIPSKASTGDLGHDGASSSVPECSVGRLVDQEHGINGPEDYDVETVERVYRKVDRRIIPGMVPIFHSTYSSNYGKLTT